MPQHYPTKTQGYKIIRVKRKIILDNRKTFMPMLDIESDKAKRTRLRPSTSQRPRRSSRIEEPHRIPRPNTKTEYQDRIKRLTTKTESAHDRATTKGKERKRNRQKHIGRNHTGRTLFEIDIPG